MLRVFVRGGGAGSRFLARSRKAERSRRIRDKDVSARFVQRQNQHGTTGKEEGGFLFRPAKFHLDLICRKSQKTDTTQPSKPRAGKKAIARLLIQKAEKSRFGNSPRAGPAAFRSSSRKCDHAEVKRWYWKGAMFL